MNYKVPGVYTEKEILSSSENLRMDITGFVGLTQEGQPNTPQEIKSWGEYEKAFGGFITFGYMPFAVYSFFANGGRKCHIVSVASEEKSLTVSDLTGYEEGVQTDPGISQLKGLALFEAIEEIGLIVIPDLIIPDLKSFIDEYSIPVSKKGVIFTSFPDLDFTFTTFMKGQQQMLLHCEKMRDRFAILDSPIGSNVRRGTTLIEGWASTLKESTHLGNGALYFPWIKVKLPGTDTQFPLIPPSGHIAGIYARSDLQKGFGKAPANEPFENAVDVEFEMSDEEQAILNPGSVNCLRIFPGRGIRIWGARTLSKDSLSRYINVRRVVLSLIKNILVRFKWIVFEPNDADVQEKIKDEISSLLNDFFNKGMLAGETVDEAFFVKCDEENNPLELIDQGQLLIEIGVAPARPAEFIIVTLKKMPGTIFIG